MTETPRNLLLTGGWDSTYRMLHLLLVEKRPVQPYYIFDPNRLSFAQELKALVKIKQTLFTRHPESRELLLPTIMYDLTEIKDDPEIQNAEKEALKILYFGNQYEWLARFVKQFNITDAEMCLENHHGLLGAVPMLKPMMETGEDGIMRMAKEHEGTPVYTVFGSFVYPVLMMTKPEMQEIAREKGYLDILEMSWFCHNPNFLGQPCGLCNPCKDALTKGMPHRVPLLGTLRFKMKKLLDPRPLLKKNPALFNFLKGIKTKLLPQNNPDGRLRMTGPDKDENG